MIKLINEIINSIYINYINITSNNKITKINDRRKMNILSTKAAY